MNEIQMGNPEDESRDGNNLTDADFSLIVDEYWKKIELPIVRPKIKYILCPIGLVGAGKSTVVKPLSIELNLARVSGDEIRELLSQKGFNNVRTIEIAFHVVQRLVKEGFSIAIDSDCAGKNIISTIEAQAQKHGYKVFYIHINPPEEFILNKLRQFKHTGLFKDADQAIATYFRRKPLHEDIQLPFIYTFDTSRQDLEEQKTEALRLIREKTE